jgi:hypothetical protein
MEAIRKNLQANPLPQNLEQAVNALKPGSLTTPTGQVNAQYFDPNFDLSSIPNVDPTTVSAAQQQTMAASRPAQTAAQLMREQEDLARRPNEGVGNRPGLTNPPASTVDQDAIRRAQEEAARRAAEQEAARRAAEAEAARKAAEEAARLKAEEDARRAAEEAARRAAEEQARRAAEEEARRRAEQDAQAARAAEEARRLAEENARRIAAEEEARKAAEAEARRRAEEEARRREEERNKPPAQPPPAAKPPGLIDSPLPGAQPPTGGGKPAPPAAPPPITVSPTPGTGIQFPSPPPQPPKDEDRPIRTTDFIDKNLNGIDDRDEKPDTGKPGFNFNWGAIDPNSDVGRLLGRIGKPKPGTGTGKPGYDLPRPRPPETGGGKPAPAPGEPPRFVLPEPPSSPGAPGGYTPGPIPVTNIPTPGYIANPLPVAPGQGTSTPYFTPTPGSLTPGTLPTNMNLPSLQSGNVPLQAIAQNPNLGPTILGGAQNAGYYTDRFGNVILSPGAVRPGGRAKGGPASDAELLALLYGENKEDSGSADLDSARAMLENLSNAPGETVTEYSSTPVSQTVRRSTRRPISEKTDKGTARGMAMELESLTAAQEPKRAPDTLAELLKMSEAIRSRDALSAKDLMRDTFGEGRLTKKQLSRLGDLMTRRFADGGEVDSAEGLFEKLFGKPSLQTRTYMESVGDESKLREPLTEKSFSADELAKLRELIAIAESNPALSEKTGKPLPGVVDYAHHREQIRRRNPKTGMPLALLDSDFNVGESGNLRNTLGQFVFERRPDGTLVVKDRYDYTGDVAETFNPFVKYANYKGVDRPVNITLPPETKRKK